MKPRTIAVGDIHGCRAALDALLAAIQPHTDDTLVFLGDYIDRGPQSREVIERLLELESECKLKPLLGNHELMMMRSFDDYSQVLFWLENGGQAALDSYGGNPANVPESHHGFLRRCLNYWETETHFFIHANYDPLLPLTEQSELISFWTHLTTFLPPPHQNGKCAVVGHTPQRSREILQMEHLVCIDTYCVGDGWLTAFDVESGQLWQANREGILRDVPSPPPENS
jgi:serine/threonine protein phosphatase 1